MDDGRSIDAAAMGQPQIAKVSRPFLTPAQMAVLKGESGMSGSAGAARRIEAFFYLWAVCRQLRLPVRTFTTAALFIQRMMLLNQVRDVPLTVLAGSCILCAFKIEDTPKKASDIAATCLRLHSPPPPNNTRLSMSSIEELNTKILSFEKHVLETISFDFRIEHPHTYVIKLCHTLQVPQKVASLAWSMATDAYATEAVLSQPAHTVALACVVVASKALEFKVPPIESSRLGSNREEVNEVIFELLNHYLIPAAPLPRAPIAARGLDTAKLVPFRDSLSKEVGVHRVPVSPSQNGFEGLGMRDSSLSDRGTARFVLDWERDHLDGETLS